MEQLVNDIIKSLEMSSDPKRIDFAKKSYPTKMRVIGVTVPDLKIVLNELKKQTKHFSIPERIDLAVKLNQTSIFECQQLALEYIGNDKNVASKLSEVDVNRLEENLDNWVSVDYFGALIVGNAWRCRNITTDKVKSYLKSNDFWIRRIGIVATVSLNQKARGGLGDSKQTLEICQLVVDDHNEMIVKALSWAFRELAKINKESVVEFIELNKNRLNKKVLREVISKLETGRKV